MHVRSRAVADDRVLPATRLLAFVIVPILTVAFVMLWIFPEHSGQLFSWPIRPPMTAMMLGATYLGGAWFFGRVVVAGAWHTITLGFVPVSTFAAVLGVSTLLHWDAFTPGHPSFTLWAILYLGLPFVIPVAWWRNARHDPGWTAESEPPVAGPVRVVVAAVGGVLVVASLILVVAPDVLIPSWPWTLSPLTARVLGAMFALSGIVGIAIAIDRRPGAARAVVQGQAIAIIGILVGLVRAADEVAWSSPASWLFAGGMVVVLAFNVMAAYRVRRAPRRR